MTAAASSMSDLPTVEHPLRDPNPLLGPRPSPLTNMLPTLQHALLPCLNLHGGLSIIAYGLARATDRVDLKDYLWPSGMLLNAWWTAVGRHALLAPHAPALEILQSLSYSQRVLLGGVTAWAGRLFYRVVRRSVQRGEDDVRYESGKRAVGFWNKAILLFGVEAVFQTLISLPFTLPFRGDALGAFSGASAEWAPMVRWTAAGLFTAGLALETVADWQLDVHKQCEVKEREQGKKHGDLLRAGVWSIVRHPNYLGDALVHFSFPLWCYGSHLFTWPQLLGPAANYVFLRWIGGDRENEASQVQRYAKEDRHKHAQLELYQLQKHAFWPSVFELGNPWTWIVVAIGAGGALGEYLFEFCMDSAISAANPMNAVAGETLTALT